MHLSGLYDLKKEIASNVNSVFFGSLRLKIIIPLVRLFVLLLKINVSVETSWALCCSAQRTDPACGRLWRRDDKKSNQKGSGAD